MRSRGSFPTVGAEHRARLATSVLALDAATYEGSVAVIRDGRGLAVRTVAMRGETEERLMPAVLAALAEAGCTIREVDRVVCGEGPGSFTSLRIAGAIAKGVALGNAVPLYAVSSLALVVAGAPDLAPGAYLAVLDAMQPRQHLRDCDVERLRNFAVEVDLHEQRHQQHDRQRCPAIAIHGQSFSIEIPICILQGPCQPKARLSAPKRRGLERNWPLVAADTFCWHC